MPIATYCSEDNVYYPEYTQDELAHCDLLRILDPCNHLGLVGVTLSRPYSIKEKTFLSFKNDNCYEQMLEMIESDELSSSDAFVLMNTENESLRLYPVESRFLMEYESEVKWMMSVDYNDEWLPF